MYSKTKGWDKRPLFNKKKLSMTSAIFIGSYFSLCASVYIYQQWKEQKFNTEIRSVYYFVILVQQTSNTRYPTRNCLFCLHDIMHRTYTTVSIAIEMRTTKQNLPPTAISMTRDFGQEHTYEVLSDWPRDYNTTDLDLSRMFKPIKNMFFYASFTPIIIISRIIIFDHLNNYSTYGTSFVKSIKALLRNAYTRIQNGPTGMCKQFVYIAE